MIKQIFKQQQFLDEMITFEYGSASILERAVALQQEAAEVVGECGFKYWKTEHAVDTDRIKEELIDVFTFVVSMANAVGMTADEFIDGYFKKNKINIERLSDGY